jgi:hypothetical protein
MGSKFARLACGTKRKVCAAAPWERAGIETPPAAARRRARSAAKILSRNAFKPIPAIKSIDGLVARFSQSEGFEILLGVQASQSR